MKTRKNAPETFLVAGVIEEEETGRPLSNLIVRAFDRDLIFDDKLGFASTDSEGRFEIRYGEADFRDLWESKPDLYLRIYDAQGSQLLHETTDAIRWNASIRERYRIRIPSRAFDPTRVVR
jgi:hypothetical protein